MCLKNRKNTTDYEYIICQAHLSHTTKGHLNLFSPHPEWRCTKAAICVSQWFTWHVQRKRSTPVSGGMVQTIQSYSIQNLTRKIKDWLKDKVTIKLVNHRKGNFIYSSAFWEKDTKDHLHKDAKWYEEDSAMFGLQHRPIMHTCSNTLELKTSDDNYFRWEFQAVLSQKFGVRWFFLSSIKKGASLRRKESQLYDPQTQCRVWCQLWGNTCKADVEMTL